MSVAPQMMRLQKYRTFDSEVIPDASSPAVSPFQSRGTPAYRPYLLALLTHQSNWSTLLQCISALLSKRRDYKYTYLFFLVTCCQAVFCGVICFCFSMHEILLSMSV